SNRGIHKCDAGLLQPLRQRTRTPHVAGAHVDDRLHGTGMGSKTTLTDADLFDLVDGGQRQEDDRAALADLLDAAGDGARGLNRLYILPVEIRGIDPAARVEGEVPAHASTHHPHPDKAQWRAHARPP